MYFSYFIPLFTLAAIFSPLPANAQIVSYGGFQNQIACSGPYFYCRDTGGYCCKLPNDYGASAQFWDLPAGAQGQGYSTLGSECVGHMFNVYGPGTRCWNGGGRRAPRLSWFNLGRRDGGIEAPIGKANCTVPPNYFRYEDGAGIEKKIKVPTDVEDAAEKIAELYSNKDYESLAGYETY